ncbi:MAG: ABC transporter permease subunit [Verrucomicrobiales bacterium]|nr:ABC transporter permease subunit [Verrucomicrobiales bacterium]
MRRRVDLAFTLVTACGACVACAVLGGIVAALLVRGLPAVSWRFLTEQIRLVGADGGIFYNLVGTLILLATALMVSAPVAMGLALVEGVYLAGAARWRRRVHLAIYLLNGVPSLLFGLFGFVVFVKYLDWGKSWLTGGLLLGMMMVPTVTVALTERIRGLPRAYVEAAAGLGLSRSQIIWSVILPQSLTGWLTGTLLGLARAAGETAPIMFTATIFAGATIPSGVKESPVLSLPYHIFVLSQDSFDPAVGARVWGTAVVLLGVVGGLSLLALPFRLRQHEEARHD